MTEEFNRKIKKAVKKLLTLEQVTLASNFTSHYSYGMLPPCLEDRYNLDIKIDSDLTLKSNDYKQMYLYIYILILKKSVLKRKGESIPLL